MFSRRSFSTKLKEILEFCPWKFGNRDELIKTNPKSLTSAIHDYQLTIDNNTNNFHDGLNMAFETLVESIADRDTT